MLGSKADTVYTRGAMRARHFLVHRERPLPAHGAGLLSGTTFVLRSPSLAASIATAALFLGCGSTAPPEPLRTMQHRSPQTTDAALVPPPPDLSHVTDFRAVVEAMAPYAPCLGVETLSREVFELVWTILGDVVSAELWHLAAQYFQLAGDARDVDPLIRFVTEGYEGELGYDERDRAILRGLYTGLFAIGSLGGRLQEEGEREAAERALSFLLECADLRFWDSGRVRWRVRPYSDVDPDPRVHSAHQCIMNIGHFPSTASLARLESRRNELIGLGLWRDILEGAMVQARRDHRQIAAAGGARAFYAQSYGYCPEP